MLVMGRGTAQMETDSLEAVIQKTAKQASCTPPARLSNPLLPARTWSFGLRKEIRAPTTNGMTELAHLFFSLSLSPETHQVHQTIYSELGHILLTLAFLY